MVSRSPPTARSPMRTISTRYSFVLAAIRRCSMIKKHSPRCANRRIVESRSAACRVVLMYWRARACSAAITARFHWEHIPAFVEEFPQLKVERTLFVIDRDRITCAGGVAALDMMIELIARTHGAELATAVSEWYLHTRTRSGTESQRMALRERTGVANKRLLKTLAAMEARLENPASRSELAQIAGVTLRQLERLFADHLGTTIAKRYAEIRLKTRADIVAAEHAFGRRSGRGVRFRQHQPFFPGLQGTIWRAPLGRNRKLPLKTSCCGEGQGHGASSGFARGHRRFL